MGLVDYAKEELGHAGLLDDDSDYDGMLGKGVLEIVKVFAKQGHSGMSASIARSLLNKLLAYEPLSPLTGEDDEWIDQSEISGKPCWQNRRCHNVFKNEDGKTYRIDGKVFKRGDLTFTDNDSIVEVKFPYFVCPPEIVEVD